MDPNLTPYGARITPVFRRYVLLRYLVCLRATAATAGDVLPPGVRDMNARGDRRGTWAKSNAGVLLGLLRGTIIVWSS